MIEIDNLIKSYGQLDVIKGINMNVEKGEVISIIGASGSGKSTLLYCINALENIQGGRIIVDGIDAHARDCLLYTSPSPRDATLSRMPSSA